MAAKNAPILVRGNVFVNNTAPSEAAALFSFDMQGWTTSPHTLEHNVWVGNVLRGSATNLGRPHDRAAIAPIVRLILPDARQANVTFVNNVLQNPLARFELSLAARYTTGQWLRLETSPKRRANRANQPHVGLFHISV